jgi:hypothetical protein
VVAIEDDPQLSGCMAAGMSSWAIDELGPTLTRRDEVGNIGGVGHFLVLGSRDRVNEGFWESEECSIASANDRMSSGEVRERDVVTDGE